MRFRRRHRGPRDLRRIALLPTLVTLANAVCGVLAMQSLFEGDPLKAAWLVMIGMIFDALDGKVARATGTTSAFGAQLDSLCDAVTFGFVPALLGWRVASGEAVAVFPPHIVTAACAFYATAAIIRLARFNIESTPDLASHLEFKGLPSPAAAGVIASTILLWGGESRGHFYDPIVRGLPILLFVTGVLMISRVRYPHVVNRFFSGFTPFVALVEIVVAVVLVVAFKDQALFLLFTGYALVGPLAWLKNRLFAPVTEPSPSPAAPPGDVPPPPSEDDLF